MNVKQLLDLNGKTALVTGGSRGLGLQMAEALGEMGARLALTARKKNELDEAVSHLGKSGIEAAAYVCDIGKTETIPAVAEEILKRLGSVDILVNNAGATWGAPAEDHPFDAWQKVMNVNLSGMFVLTQAIAKRSMIPRRYGRIINNASVAGLTATDPHIMRGIAYHASKGGVINFTRALAAEWGEHGITVNSICPGFFPSKMSKGVIDSAGQYIIDHTPTRRLGNEEDLKGLIVLLASDASRHITGQAIAVDGGATVI
ncbi:MAG: gluconate 5-dehydrogenase [Betaproteobacteria bacterium RIFCSPLOWO2_12_FULL_65_14]|nr:MAG: gluconate 5-dehydrogenase [Betaproteobacteria bacterium RIFCSPLOWO2_12_FULL_65_14]